MSPDETTVPETIKSEINPNRPPFVPNVPLQALPTQTSTQNCEQSSNTYLALNQLINLQARQTELSSLLIKNEIHGSCYIGSFISHYLRKIKIERKV